MSTYNALDDAVTMARAGWSVFPVHAVTKGPPLGFLWKALATNRINHVVEAFTNAEAEFGAGNVSVAWALGLDQCVACDLDAVEAPEFWSELKESAVSYLTLRGEHLVFAWPDGMTPGNGVSGFPERGWGEVRGAGGYVVPFGPDRPGLDVNDLAGLAKFPRPEWLTEAVDPVDAVSAKAVEAFLDEHTSMSSRGAVIGLGRMMSGRLLGDIRRGSGKTWPTSIHECGVETACMIAREVAAGLYPARGGFRLWVEWWDARWAERKRNGNGRTEPNSREASGIMRYAVAQAIGHPDAVAAVRAKRERELEEWKQQQADMKADRMTAWIKKSEVVR